MAAVCGLFALPPFYRLDFVMIEMFLRQWDNIVIFIILWHVYNFIKVFQIFFRSIFLNNFHIFFTFRHTKKVFFADFGIQKLVKILMIKHIFAEVIFQFCQWAIIFSGTNIYGSWQTFYIDFILHVFTLLVGVFWPFLFFVANQICESLVKSGNLRSINFWGFGDAYLVRPSLILNKWSCASLFPETLNGWSLGIWRRRNSVFVVTFGRRPHGRPSISKLWIGFWKYCRFLTFRLLLNWSFIVMWNFERS